MRNFFETVAVAGVEGGQTTSAEAPSAQAWFEGGERIGYDPRSRAIIASADAPLQDFLAPGRRSAHAISFLPWIP